MLQNLARFACLPAGFFFRLLSFIPLFFKCIDVLYVFCFYPPGQTLKSIESEELQQQASNFIKPNTFKPTATISISIKQNKPAFSLHYFLLAVLLQDCEKLIR